MKQGKSIKVEASIGSNKASIRITDYIGGGGSDTYSIRAAVADVLNNGLTDAEVYISSQGGSVFEATEIVNELKKIQNVKIRVGALAASAATYITSSFYTIAGAASQFMIHKPMLHTSGTVEKIKADTKLLENLTADYLRIYAAKTGMKEEAVQELWTGGDYWMTANEALNLGFVDEVESTATEITVNDLALLEACGAPNKPNITHKNQKNKMDKLIIIAALGLAADATEDVIMSSITELKTKAKAYETEKANAEQLKGLRADALVDRAIAAKKIGADQKEHYKKLATADYDSVSSILDGMVGVQALSVQLGGNGQAPNPRAGWTIADYLEKDPKALVALEKENPEAYAALEADYIQ